MKKKYKKLGGFTLLETVVAVALFSVVVVSILGSFSKMMQSQYEIYDMQELQDSARYFLEVLSKETRMAKIDKNGVCAGEDKIFYSESFVSGESLLKFLNHSGECIQYQFVPSSGIIYKKSGGNAGVSMFPNDIKAEAVSFASSDDIEGGEQPIVSIRAALNNINYSEDAKKFKIQTTISARAYP